MRVIPVVSQEQRVGVLFPNPLLMLQTQAALVMHALREPLEKSGYALEVHANAAYFSGKPERALEKLTQENPADAWLVFTSRQPMQHWFIRRQLPCLVIGSCAPEISLPSVDADHRGTCRHVGGLLVRKGHRRIALVLPEGDFGGDNDSEQGLREALEGSAAASLKVLRHDGSTRHLCDLLDAAMRSAHPPTAYLMARPTHVLTVMMHLLRRGKSIPEDVAVISRDDDPSLLATCPAVTRYTLNPTLLARRVSPAVRQLAETGTLEPKAIRLIPKFFPGETV